MQYLSQLQGVSVGISNVGSTGFYVASQTLQPSSTKGGLLVPPPFEDSPFIFDVSHEDIWILVPAQITITYLNNSMIPPEGVYTGERALNVQGYEESNIKLGLQFEGSKNFGELAGGTVLNTIFKTGNLPVSLKKRIASFTGVGIQAEIYINPTYTGGTVEPYQNATTISPATGLSQIIVGINLTDQGTLAFAPIYAFGNASNQGKGGVLTLVEPEHILAPNTDFLLRLTSLDANNQTIASHLNWYEGELDLPRP